MKLTTVATLLFSALSTQLVAAELDTNKVKFIGPLADTATIKPNNTPYQTAIINNLFYRNRLGKMDKYIIYFIFNYFFILIKE